MKAYTVSIHIVNFIVKSSTNFEVDEKYVNDYYEFKIIFKLFQGKLHSKAQFSPLSAIFAVLEVLPPL